jgi:transposase
LLSTWRSRKYSPNLQKTKNCLFDFTEKGAEAGCILFSIVETAKQNHLDVYKYLEYVLSECRGIHKDRQISKEKAKKLLPWSKHLPDHIKTPEKA